MSDARSLRFIEIGQHPRPAAHKAGLSSALSQPITGQVMHAEMMTQLAQSLIESELPNGRSVSVQRSSASLE